MRLRGMRVYLVLTILPIAATLATGSVAILSWQRRTVPGARAFSFFAASLYVWCFFSVFEYLSQDTFARILFGKLQYFGISTFAVFWLAFTLQYTHQDSWLTRRNWVLSLVLPGLSLIFSLLAPRLGLIWRSVEAVRGPVLTLSIEHGWWFNWVMVPYNYLLFSLGIGLLLQASFANSRLYRQQTLFLLAAGLFPFLFNVIYVVADVTFYGMDLTPIGMAVSSVMVMFGLFQTRLFELSPIPYRTVFLSTAEAVILLDRYQQIVDLNPSAEQTCRQANPIGQPLEQVFPEYSQCLQMTAAARVITVADAASEYREVKVRPLTSPAGQPVGTVLIVRDVTLEQRQQRQLERDAYLDSLTGVFNRRQFQQSAEQALQYSRQQGTPLALLFVDLNNFKPINDTYGHAAGDSVLRHVADCLQASIRAGDGVARMGGDEFVLLLQTDRIGATRMCDRITERLQSPVIIDQRSIDVEVSIGVACYPTDGTSVESLLAVADQAMYRQKQARRR
ncbi:MAG: histidine kinase N-terminal 7TM domain-containing protein [Cyanobacteria bacterium J06627_15]